MYTPLLRIRMGQLRNFLVGLERTEQLRLLGGLAVLGVLLGGASLELFDLKQLRLDTPALSELSRMHVYRLSGLLAGAIALSSFELLWRNRDLEVLTPLPIPGRAMLHYRLVSIGMGHLPLLLLALLAFLPLFWHGHARLGLEAILCLVMTFLASLVGSLAWHGMAALSVASPRFGHLKAMLKGAMVLPERTLLLYSPLMATSTGFGSGFLCLIGLSALARGQILLGLPAVALGALIAPLAYLRARWVFEKHYYRALAGLQDGEQLGELSDPQASSAYLGQWYGERLPLSVRPLVRRDLLQAWRRSRLDYVLLWSASGALALYVRARPLDLEASSMPITLATILLALAGGLAFRLTRSGCDSPLLWMMVPIPVWKQARARVVAVGFFPVTVLPMLWAACSWGGTPGLEALLGLLLLGIAFSGLATVLSLRLFTQARAGVTLYGALAAVVIFSFPGALLPAGALALLLAAVSLLGLRQLGTRLGQQVEAR